jgi:hypothetical protein
MGEHRLACQLGGGSVARRRRLGLDQLGGIRIEAEADLAAALLDKRRQPIREGSFQRINRP